MSDQWTWLLRGVIALAVILFAFRMGKSWAQLDYVRAELNPPPPVNVYVQLSDGRTIPVDAVLSPVRTWLVIIPEGLDPHTVEALCADEMPSDTIIEFEHRV